MIERWRIVIVLSLIAGLGLVPVSSQARTSKAHSLAQDHRHDLMSNVKSWGYQLQGLDTDALAASPFDLLVIDHAPERVESVEIMYRRQDLARLKVKPDGSRRIVLAYVSIGEAERYRFYWDDAWLKPTGCPVWLGPVNPAWAGNYPVQFWQLHWQRLIYGASDSYVDRVLDAGFDGIYLDRADVYDEFKTHPNARTEMVAFVSAIADHARKINPHAIVVLQNAEELLTNKALQTRLDGAAKESLYYNADHASKANSMREQSAAAGGLRALKKAGGKIMVVEYLSDVEKARQARAQALADGFLIHFTERSLSTLNIDGAQTPPLPQVAQTAAQSAAATTPPEPSRPCG